MSELHPTWATAEAPETPAPALRVVPDHAPPLGDGVLLAESVLDQEMVCRRVLQVTPDVVTLVLQPTWPGGVAFVPGQYVTLGVDVDGERMERCYTISSPPTRPHLLTVTVKRVPGGVVSTWLNDRFRTGDRVQVSGPLGSFSVTEHPAWRYLLLSAGSGVTPTLSTLRTVVDLGERVDVVVVHSARTPSDRVCAAEIEAMAAAHPGLSVHWVCEEGDVAEPDAWGGPRGRLTADLLRTLVPDAAEREVLTCGPPGYMAAVRRVLAEAGVPAERCHEESFVLGTPAAPAVPPALETEPGPGPDVEEVTSAVATLVTEAATTVGPMVRFGRSGREIACPPGTTVLAAAEQAGVSLPSSCAEGLCGSCKQTLLSGKVDMKHQGGIRPREIAQDKFLPCCSTPDGDIVVDA